jgi:hypothetical protein
LTAISERLFNTPQDFYHALTIINAMNGMVARESSIPRMGWKMGRAFREGISDEKKVRFHQRISQMMNIGGRARRSKAGEGPRVRVPAMITVEDEEWIWEQVSADVLASLSHRLMIQDAEGNAQPLGCTADFDTALALAKEMASEGEVILIEPNL